LGPLGLLGPPGVAWAPRVCRNGPPGVKFVPPLFAPRGENCLMFRRTKGRTEGLHPWVPTLPLGANFTPGCQLHPWVPTSPLGANFTPGCQLHPWVLTSPRCEVKNLPQVKGTYFSRGHENSFEKLPSAYVMVIAFASRHVVCTCVCTSRTT
jgi:hypothetical protein